MTRRSLLAFVDFLRSFNQNPQWLMTANRLEQVAEHGTDAEVVTELNRVREGIALVVRG